LSINTIASWKLKTTKTGEKNETLEKNKVFCIAETGKKNKNQEKVLKRLSLSSCKSSDLSFFRIFLSKKKKKS
jgi:hypothetical protein